MSNTYEQWSRIISAGFKELLESKHLYQSVHLPFQEALESLKGAYGGPTVEHLLETISRPWHAQTPNEAFRPAVTVGDDIFLSFQFTDAKMFCINCERREPYNVRHVRDFLPNSQGQSRFEEHDQTIQVFVTSLQCQSCKRTPEVFLVRREESKITLSGRAPIAAVDVPHQIPKIVRKYYSDAIVAHQSGQTLAGNFLLRTLIEQFSRDWMSNSTVQERDELLRGRPSDLVEAYTGSLPDDIRDRLPSLSALYKVLSDDVHTAKGDPTVFETTLEDLGRHFDARRLFRLNR